MRIPTRRSWKRWVAAALCFIALLGGLFSNLREPSYNGQRASKWFEQAEALKSEGRDDALKPIAQAFQKMGADGIDFLVDRLRRTDSHLKRRAVQQLLRVPLPDKAKGWLLSLQTSNVGSRYNAVAILSALGPAAESALPALVTASRDEDTSVSFNAAVAIRKVAPPPIAIPILVNCVNELRSQALAGASFCLFDLADDNDCSAAIPALRGALVTREEWGWFETARALSKIDPDHSATLLLPNVSKLLSEPATVPHRFPKRILQLFALEIAANLGPPAEQCLPHLLSLTNAPDEMINRAANKAVKRIGVESRSSRATPTNDISNDIPK